MKHVRLFFAVLVVLLVLALASAAYLMRGGVSHRDLKDAVEHESATIQARLDERSDALNRRLDRIEAKLDRLIDMATPKLSDGMTVAE